MFANLVTDAKVINKASATHHNQLFEWGNIICHKFIIMIAETPI